MEANTTGRNKRELVEHERKHNAVIVERNEDGHRAHQGKAVMGSRK